MAAAENYTEIIILSVSVYVLDLRYREMFYLEKRNKLSGNVCYCW